MTSQPGAPLTGTQHLNVTALRAADKAALPDAEVTLTLTSPSGDSSVHRARPGASGYFFTVAAPFVQPGRWRMSLAVRSAWGWEEAAFSRYAFTPLQLGASFSLIIAALVSVMALLGFGTFDLPGRSGGRKQVPAPTSTVE